MKSDDDIEQQMEQFGRQWRACTSLADRVVPLLQKEPCDVSTKSSWFGELTMTQRVTFGGFSAALIAVVILLTSTSTAPVTFAQVVENVRQAKTYSVKITANALGEGPEATHEPTSSQVIYWKAPNSFRWESWQDLQKQPTMDEVQIVHRNKPGINIKHAAKSYCRKTATRGFLSPLAMLEKLGTYQGRSHKQLGTKLISEIECEGFEIKIKEIDPDAHDGNLTLWVNTKTKLPETVILRMGNPVPMVMQMEEFQWNTPLADELFDATPPEGYTDTTPPVEDIKETVAYITAAFKLYAQLSGGHYPKVKMVYGDVTRDAMFRMSGLKGERNPEWHQDPKYSRIMEVSPGFSRINTLLVNNPDAAYHGVDVGPKNAGRVLFRWKLEDGQYQVIYGDLRSEAVTVKKLRGLE